MSDFAKLLEELQGETASLAKALPADDGDGDENIAAAAAEGGGQAAVNKENDEDGAGDGTGGQGAEAPMAKSFKVKLEDGSEVDALDAGELVKSLQDQVGALTGKLTASEELMQKALGDTLGVVKAQGALIKSLSERVTKLSGEGRGRKTVLTMHEKPAVGAEAAMAKAQGNDGAMKPEEFLAKADAAWNAGKISGVQLSAIDVTMRTPGAKLDPALIKTVIEA